MPNVTHLTVSLLLHFLLSFVLLGKDVRSYHGIQARSVNDKHTSQVRA
jgi:hypothetical protein